MFSVWPLNLSCNIYFHGWCPLHFLFNWSSFFNCPGHADGSVLYLNTLDQSSAFCACPSLSTFWPIHLLLYWPVLHECHKFSPQSWISDWCSSYVFTIKGLNMLKVSQYYQPFLYKRSRNPTGCGWKGVIFKRLWRRFISNWHVYCACYVIMFLALKWWRKKVQLMYHLKI